MCIHALPTACISLVPMCIHEPPTPCMPPISVCIHALPSPSQARPGAIQARPSRSQNFHKIFRSVCLSFCLQVCLQFACSLGKMLKKQLIGHMWVGPKSQKPSPAQPRPHEQANPHTTTISSWSLHSDHPYRHSLCKTAGGPEGWVTRGLEDKTA